MKKMVDLLKKVRLVLELVCVDLEMKYELLEKKQKKK
jgi:hypothetical protein